MDRTEKETMLGEIKEAFQNVASVVIADYRGIRVPTVTTMRDDFRKAGCHYRVLKNSHVKNHSVSVRTKHMSISQEEVITYLSGLTVIDLVNLTKSLEEKWGVKAAPVAVAQGPAAGGGAAAAPAEEKTEFTVVLKAGGA